jgi:hypothetical protein
LVFTTVLSNNFYKKKTIPTLKKIPCEKLYLQQIIDIFTIIVNNKNNVFLSVYNNSQQQIMVDWDNGVVINSGVRALGSGLPASMCMPN